MTYDKPSPGEWIQPVRRGYKLACCDCGLVHRVDFRVRAGRIQFRVYRHERATAAMRRGQLRISGTKKAVAKAIKILTKGRKITPPKGTEST